MSDLDWSTPDGLAAIRDHLAARIDGWRQPVAYAVGLSPASSSPEWLFAHVNAPGGRHGLPAVVLATVLGHDGSTATLPLSRSQLAAAVESLAPAEACTALDHPNLAAWREVLHELEGNPAREAQAVFVADLDDPVTSEADGSMRATLRGPRPADLTDPASRRGTGGARAGDDPGGSCVGPPDGASTDLDRPTAPHHPGGPVLDALTSLLEAGAAAPWVLAVVLLIAVGDALLPPIPSEGVVVALAAVAVAGDGPHLPLLALAAGVGAFLGDSLTFVVGRRYGPQRLARVTRPRVRRVLERASGTLERRGALVVLTARYVPLGRVAVNLTAGATGFPPRRFLGLAALAARDLGRVVGGRRRAGRALADGNPLLGSAAGIALALGLGLAVDRVARRVTGWGGVAGARGIRRRRPGRRGGGPRRRLGRRGGALTTPSRGCPPRRPAVCTLHPRVPIMALALSP